MWAMGLLLASLVLVVSLLIAGGLAALAGSRTTRIAILILVPALGGITAYMVLAWYVLTNSGD
jgi:hypothetical protein